jgi:16S rRNA (cytosine967-C5)-methyltransferase
MKISPARVAAFDVLTRIETDGAFSSVLLPLHEEHLAKLDRGLCHELVMGVIRRQIYLDRVIGHFSAKKLDTAVRIALRMGAYQLLFLDKVPAYSAINESVNLVQRARKSSAKGLVNAILRKIAETPPTLFYEDDLDRVSVETSHPRWLLEKWAEDFGPQEATKIAVANNAIPRVAFRLTRNDRTPLRSVPSEYVEGGYIADAMDDELLSAAEAGEIYFQDEASQLVAQVTAKAAGTSILDVCAAPGGKTSQIAAAVDPATSHIVAGDLYESRIRLLRSTCTNQRAGFVRVVQYDAAVSLPFAEASFDTVLVDAPCSGTGTIRHNPEIRYSLAPDDLAELASKQLAILRNASKLVRLNGRLVYSTCSLQIQENEAVCAAFLAETGDFERKTPDVPDRFLTSQGFARTFPHRDDTDGFFIAEFRRVKV